MTMSMLEKIYLNFLRSPIDSSGAADAAPTSTPASANVVQSNSSDETAFDIPTNEDLDVVELLVEPATPAPSVGGQAPASGGSGPGGAAPAASVSPPVEPAVVAPPVAQAPAGGPQATQPAQPATPAAPEPGTGSSPAAPPTFEQELLTNRAAFEQTFKDQVFALSPEDLTEIETSVETFIPKLASKVLYQAVASAHRQIQQFVPEMVARGVQTYLAQKEASDGAKNKFFDAWPKLKGQDDKIAAYLRPYVIANPRASLEQRIAAVGRMVMMDLGLPLVEPPVAAQPPRQQPFMPAGGGGPAATPNGGGVVVDPWEGFLNPPEE